MKSKNHALDLESVNPEYDYDSGDMEYTKDNSSRNRKLVIGALCAIIIILAIAIGLLFGLPTGKDEDKDVDLATNPPNVQSPGTPTMSPTFAPTTTTMDDASNYVTGIQYYNRDHIHSVNYGGVAGITCKVQEHVYNHVCNSFTFANIDGASRSFAIAQTAEAAKANGYVYSFNEKWGYCEDNMVINGAEIKGDDRVIFCTKLRGGYEWGDSYITYGNQLCRKDYVATGLHYKYLVPPNTEPNKYLEHCYIQQRCHRIKSPDKTHYPLQMRNRSLKKYTEVVSDDSGSNTAGFLGIKEIEICPDQNGCFKQTRYTKINKDIAYDYFDSSKTAQKVERKDTTGPAICPTNSYVTEITLDSISCSFLKSDYELDFLGSKGVDAEYCAENTIITGIRYEGNNFKQWCSQIVSKKPLSLPLEIYGSYSASDGLSDAMTNYDGFTSITEYGHTIKNKAKISGVIGKELEYGVRLKRTESLEKNFFFRVTDFDKTYACGSGQYIQSVNLLDGENLFTCTTLKPNFSLVRDDVVSDECSESKIAVGISLTRNSDDKKDYFHMLCANVHYSLAKPFNIRIEGNDEYFALEPTSYRGFTFIQRSVIEGNTETVVSGIHTFKQAKAQPQEYFTPTTNENAFAVNAILTKHDDKAKRCPDGFYVSGFDFRKPNAWFFCSKLRPGYYFGTELQEIKPNAGGNCGPNRIITGYGEYINVIGSKGLTAEVVVHVLCQTVFPP